MSVTLFDDSYDAHGKSAAEIERDIAQTRAGLGEVLGAIERRMAPQQLLEQGMDRLMDGVNGQIGDLLRGNPIPLALIGAGIGWLLLAGTGGRAAAKPAAAEDPIVQAAAPAPESAYATGSSYGAAEDIAGLASARVESGWSVSAAANEAKETVRDGMARVLDNPLALGFIGLVAGAALAMTLPRSRIEARWLGPARARAAEMGRDAIDRARQAAEQAVEGASDALKSATDSARQAAEQAVEGVSSAFKTSTDRARQMGEHAVEGAADPSTAHETADAIGGSGLKAV